VARPADGASPPVEKSATAQPACLSRTILADGEVVILSLKPSPWFVLLASAPAVAIGIIIVLASNIEWLESRFPTWQGYMRQAGLWIVVLRLLWATLQWACRYYVLTDRRVIRQRGVLNLQVFECRLDRLQNTFLQRTLVQRVLGIGTIFFATAGTGHVEAMWQHVRRPADVHRQITEAASRFHKIMGNNGI
jgi:uncharacterized membrane protein YdbT with pleckstrin-like domain